MLIIEAIVLGAIQGLSEFIPVSSSGHLILVPKLMGWQYMGKSFDVALHWGTLVALVTYYRRDLISIITGFVNHVFGRVAYGKDAGSSNGRLLVPILVATIPAGVVGWKFDHLIEEKLTQWSLIAGALVVVGLVMLLAEQAGKKRRGCDQMNYVDYILIGCAQALALFPGVSRSGITISTGLFRNLNREAAARFSFLLSTPAILGAGILKFKDLEHLPGNEVLPFVLGFVTSAVVGYLAIGFLINYLKNRTMNAFAIYRFAFAALMAVVFVMR